MAAYHLTAKIHSRANGASAVRAAAYRAGERLVDDRLGVTEDYSRKADVVEAAIFLPEGAPDWMSDRSRLWNAVEARERRKDAQLAQELEINLPRELSEAENWRLITDFARQYLVAEGRVCDIAFHVREASDGSLHPHAHILMPTREVTATGFGEKHPDCSWKTYTRRRDPLRELRAAWGDFARERAASLGVDLGADWDHRSFEDRGIDLEGQPKLGATAQRLAAEGARPDRGAELAATRQRNGERLLARPEIALEALTNRQSTFTRTDLARWIHRHTTDDQFQPVLDRAMSVAVRVGRDPEGRDRYSTEELIALEARMIENAAALARRREHELSGSGGRLIRSQLSGEQRTAARTLLECGDLACLIGHAGAGKSTMLGEVRRELEAKGYRVRGAALSGIAAENLAQGSGIEARTLHSLAYAWDDGRDRLTSEDVLVIDEAGMVGSRQLARFIEAANNAGAKLILVGDPEQLQAIEAGAAFRAVAEQAPVAELTEIRRQQQDWQRAATHELATGQTAEALERYRRNGNLIAADNDELARARLVAGWKAHRDAAPDQSRLMLAHTRADVRLLNDAARASLKADGALGSEVELETVHGRLAFAAGDRLLFTRNERQLGVRNGTLGTVTGIEAGRLMVETDDGRTIAVDPAAYKDLNHGYAVTIHKSQGATVDAAFLLASPGLDRHLTYVGASRHRAQLTIAYNEATFPSPESLAATLGRARPKDFTLDYREEEPELVLPPVTLAPPVPARAPTLDIPAPRPTDQFLRDHGALDRQPPVPARSPTAPTLAAPPPPTPVVARDPAPRLIAPDPVPVRSDPLPEPAPDLKPERAPEPLRDPTPERPMSELEKRFRDLQGRSPDLQRQWELQRELKRDRDRDLGL